MPSRYSTGSDQIDETIEGLIALAGETAHADLVHQIVVTAIKLIQDGTSRGDLKIINSALKEMRYSFKIFRDYRDVPKVSMFGSARTKEGDPAYVAAHDFARAIAKRDWMVISGAGPGIMQAAIEGAGPERSFGVSIRLPFESSAIEFFQGDRKLINFKYFFTRKLCFAKEAEAIILLPGGFGTLDELFETLTLVQTGKNQLIPFVMLDTPDSNYWAHWDRFIQHELLGRGLISAEDIHLYTITNDVEEAVEAICGFYRNYHSVRYVRDCISIRLKRAAGPELATRLNEEFSDLLEDGEWKISGPLPEEANEPELAALPRIVGRFDRRQYSRLRVMIDVMNDYAASH